MKARAVLRTGWLCAIVLAGPASGAPTADTLEERVDHLVRWSYDHPDEALARLRSLGRGVAASPARDRLLLQAAGQIEAQAGRAAKAGEHAARLEALSRPQQDPLADAAAQMVRAAVAEAASQIDVAAALAQSAAAVYERTCPPAVPAPAAASDCDYRSLWRALQITQRRAISVGQLTLAQQKGQRAFDLADWAGDVYRKAFGLSTLAYVAARDGRGDQALRSIAQAKRMAATLDDPLAMIRVLMNEARVADARGDAGSGLRATEEAAALAQRAGARRHQALLLVNLSDSYVKQGRPAAALRAAAQALPTVRRFNDVRAERVLINNAGLAKIGLGRIAEGKQDLAAVVALWERSGAVADQAWALREYGEALAVAGDARSALDLYHRERALTTDAMARNRRVVLAQMQSRYDTEAKQRSIDLLERDNALKTAALANRDLVQRVWGVAAAVMALSVVLAVLLYRRVRETHRLLTANEATLRVQSERDALTGLANRRHFHAAVQAAAAEPDASCDRTLLMVDIDHFKHINDGHGHVAGDVVLVEVARRLNAAVRGDDLVVRWGGEEFLIVAAKLGPEQADQLAARILASIGSTPVLAEQQAVWITASIGYACFPLAPHGVPVPWEQAINLSDMALYVAKSQGRNRAVGLVSASACDAQSLRAIEGDFERAWQEGRVTLRQTPGPGA
ncbi:GGDEF domain-containing protein [Piscinibacter sp.]|uniref:GGDEF domain-containing protein n=1 Tax=Piscinibacter sp. TaxID=1903157 RepID=UPI002CF29EE7|nr:GGDEF domain-containing protein [Albitalea sp.]HUG22989.1 GGDEF domain-containing protein [Albitalea sp.]